MRYSIYFFLIEPAKIIALHEDPLAPHQVVQHMKSRRRRASKADCKRVFETIELFQAEAFGHTADTYRFEAFLWALDSLGEPIEIATDCKS